MERSIVGTLVFVTCLAAHGQDQARYEILVKEAWKYYEQKEYKASAHRYSAAFEALGWKGYRNDRYNAACSWALAGVPDSAFFQLERIAALMDYADVAHITSDVDLSTLHADHRWDPLIRLVQANKERSEVHLDRPLAQLLDSIHEEDQRPRHQIDEVEAKYGRGSKEMQAHWQRMHETDSAHITVITRILDERGWLGPDVVGQKGSSTIFLVIQHADLATQEKYLPMMREAVQRGRARGSDLALLEDRVLMRNGKRQRYGSQVGRDPDTGTYYLSPLEDPDNVDLRRAEVGLRPIAEYLRNWDMIWDAEAYKKELPQLEERYKVRNR